MILLAHVLGYEPLLSPCHVSAAGEYIAAEKLEVDFGTCDLVEQIWVYGNSYEVSLALLQSPLSPLPCAKLLHMLSALHMAVIEYLVHSH